jgi:hypothetical protein
VRAVCGVREVAAIRIPRVGKVTPPASGKDPQREDFLRRHAHPERGHPMSWQLPLLNPAVMDGLDLDLLVMRLRADLRENPPSSRASTSGSGLRASIGVLRCRAWGC